MSQKSIPYSIEAEESLLGNILLYPETLIETIESDIVSTDFYLDKHQKIFSVIEKMSENHEKVDTISVSSKLKDFGIFDKVGGIEYLMKLTSASMGAVNTSEYIRIIKNKSLSRQVIRVGDEIANEALDAKTSINELLAHVEDKVINITRARTDAGLKSGDIVFDEAIKKIEKIQEAGGGVTGVKSGYPAIDNTTAGFQPADFIIIAARPSMGKTALALNMALNAAATSPGAVAFFSCEMPAEQIAIRMLSARSKVSGDKIKMGPLNEEDWSKLNEASQLLRKQKFYIDDSPSQKISDMLAKCRKLKNEHGLSIVFIDYIQLIDTTHSESRQQEVSELSRKLKSMARELEVPVVALSQLSRANEKREDKRPMLSDLRESGSLEQDADLVFLLFRENYYKTDERTGDAEDIEVNIAKFRNGRTGRIKLRFDKDCNAFYSISNQLEPGANE